MKTETVHDTIRSTAEIAACMTIIFSYLAFLTVEHEQLSRNLVNAAIGSAGTAVVFTATVFIIAITKRRKRKRMKETLASTRFESFQGNDHRIRGRAEKIPPRST